jgi:hypothetical protein
LLSASVKTLQQLSINHGVEQAFMPASNCLKIPAGFSPCILSLKPQAALLLTDVRIFQTRLIANC